MRIFVIGTGRCGSMTFKKACNHIENYTNAHESHTGWDHAGVKMFDYPDNHIEIDVRLSYFVPLLREKYPDAIFVHLQRERKACIKSLVKKESLLSYGIFHLGGNGQIWTKNRDFLAGVYYDSTVNMLNIFQFVDTQVYKNKFVHIWLEAIGQGFSNFLKMIDAECDKSKAYKELKIKHNKS